MIERSIERVIFVSRWLMAPIYLGLVAVLGVLVVKFMEELYHFVPHVLDLRETDVILIDRIRGRPCRYHPFEFNLHVGSRLPSYCSATGKALLAFLPQADLENLIDRLEFQPRGPRSVGSRAALLTELAQVRRTGMALNDEELESGLRSIATPIRSRSGVVVAAINLAIPWSPVAMSELTDHYGPMLLSTARQISALAI